MVFGDAAPYRQTARAMAHGDRDLDRHISHRLHLHRTVGAVSLRDPFHSQDGHPHDAYRGHHALRRDAEPAALDELVVKGVVVGSGAPRAVPRPSLDRSISVSTPGKQPALRDPLPHNAAVHLLRRRIFDGARTEHRHIAEATPRTAAAHGAWETIPLQLSTKFTGEIIGGGSSPNSSAIVLEMTLAIEAQKVTAKRAGPVEQSSCVILEGGGCRCCLFPVSTHGTDLGLSIKECFGLVA